MLNAALHASTSTVARADVDSGKYAAHAQSYFSLLTLAAYLEGWLGGIKVLQWAVLHIRHDDFDLVRALHLHLPDPDPEVANRKLQSLRTDRFPCPSSVYRLKQRLP